MQFSGIAGSSLKIFTRTNQIYMLIFRQIQADALC